MMCASRRVLAVLLAGAVLALACTDRAALAPAPDLVEAAPPVAAPTPGGVTVVVVLPPADRLDPAHLVVLESDLEATDAVAGAGVRELRILTPPTEPFRPDLITTYAERSAQLVCVLGADAELVVAPFVALHPTTRFCAAPARSSGGVDDASVARLDLQVEELGYLLGAAAATTVGEDGTVGVLLGGDELPADRLLAGVRAAAADLQLLQVPSRSDGGVDPSAEVDALVEAGASLLILDGSFGASEAVARAVTSGVAIILPVSLADGAPNDLIVATWEVSWAAVLADFLAEVLLIDGDRPSAALQASVGVAEDAFAVSVGGAAPGSLPASLATAREGLIGGGIDLEPG